MQKTLLKNGLTVLVESRKSQSIAVEVSVGVGSNYESRKQAGLSHFLEHMLFNGSLKRPTALAITNEIEKIGGELNGGTSNEQTCFYVKVPSKHFEKALDVLSDMLFRPLFKPEDVEKERKVVLNEVKLFTDDPKLHVWVMLQKKLYVRHPTRNPVYGRAATISRFTRKDLVDFHRRFYVPGNMSIAVVGNVKKSKALSDVRKYFSGFHGGQAPVLRFPKEPRQLKPKFCTERRKILQSYIVLAFKTKPRQHKDSYALDVAHAILGRKSSGRIFDEIRNKRGLAYDISVQSEALKDFGFFSVYVVADKKNVDRIVGIILDELKMKRLDARDLEEAKTFIEGEVLLDNEDNLKMAEMLSFFNYSSKAEEALNYLKRIRRVSLGQVRNAVKKYLNRNYTLVVVG
jgi:predicted Zn-dependent peptidase